MQRKQSPVPVAIHLVNLFKLIFGSARTHLNHCALGKPPEKIASQMVRRTFTVHRNQSEISAKVHRGLAEVSRQPAGECVLSQCLVLSSQKSRWSVRNRVFHKSARIRG